MVATMPRFPYGAASAASVSARTARRRSYGQAWAASWACSARTSRATPVQRRPRVVALDVREGRRPEPAAVPGHLRDPQRLRGAGGQLSQPVRRPLPARPAPRLLHDVPGEPELGVPGEQVEIVREGVETGPVGALRLGVVVVLLLGRVSPPEDRVEPRVRPVLVESPPCLGACLRQLPRAQQRLGALVGGQHGLPVVLLHVWSPPLMCVSIVSTPPLSGAMTAQVNEEAQLRDVRRWSPAH
ncbi:hypothetical protein [Streptomyces sp. NPDC016845]|uniref:hypothetical protein n=1 Tax=Streptomyces sp. NPDC016845 TaxID=3364972 RepID=UPI00378CBB64